MHPELVVAGTLDKQQHPLNASTQHAQGCSIFCESDKLEGYTLTIEAHNAEVLTNQ